MDMDKVRVLRDLIYIISTFGILVGIDLLFGAKILSKLNKTLNRTILDFDVMIAKILSYFRSTVDRNIDIDQKIIKTKAKIVLGCLFIAICVVMIFFARQD